MENNSPGKT